MATKQDREKLVKGVGSVGAGSPTHQLCRAFHLPTSRHPQAHYPASPPSKGEDSAAPTLPSQHKAQKGANYLPPQNLPLPCSLSRLRIPPSASSLQVSTTVPTLLVLTTAPRLSLQPSVTKLCVFCLPKASPALPLLSIFPNLLWAKIASYAISSPLMRRKSLFIHLHWDEFISPRA